LNIKAAESVKQVERQKRTQGVHVREGPIQALQRSRIRVRRLELFLHESLHAIKGPEQRSSVVESIVSRADLPCQRSERLQDRVDVFAHDIPAKPFVLTVRVRDGEPRQGRKNVKSITAARPDMMVRERRTCTWRRDAHQGLGAEEGLGNTGSIQRCKRPQLECAPPNS
jgi:hypothetical protein